MTFSSNLRSAASLLALLSVTALPASAQDLVIGSPAPALSIEEWLKGEAVASFAPGKIYVVEFWATWCPPCITSIPHLSELQKKYRDSKVTVIGVAASERAKQKGADLRAPLVKFIADQGEKMAYTVAYDSDHSMSKTWMEPARLQGIPSAFIVDGTGTIAWIGHPMEMDDPLAQVAAGKWDVKAEAAKAKAKAELQAKLEPIIQRASNAAQAKDWDGAIAAIDEAIALGDDALVQLSWFKYNMHVEKKDFEGAYAFIEKHLKGALKGEADLLNAIAWGQVDPEQAARIEKKNYELALACSLRACELQKDKDGENAFLDIQASVHFAKGDAEKAAEVESRAIALTKDKDELEAFTKKFVLYKQAIKKD